MPTLNHLHIYEQSRDNAKIMRCIHPDCMHFTTRNHIRGKRAQCPDCGQSFILTPEFVRMKRPHCEACKNPNRQKAQLKQHSPTVTAIKDENLDTFEVNDADLLANLNEYLKRK